MIYLKKKEIWNYFHVYSYVMDTLVIWWIRATKCDTHRRKGQLFAFSHNLIIYSTLSYYLLSIEDLPKLPFVLCWEIWYLRLHNESEITVCVRVGIVGLLITAADLFLIGKRPPAWVGSTPFCYQVIWAVWDHLVRNLSLHVFLCLRLNLFLGIQIVSRVLHLLSFRLTTCPDHFHFKRLASCKTPFYLRYHSYKRLTIYHKNFYVLFSYWISSLEFCQ